MNRRRLALAVRVAVIAVIAVWMWFFVRKIDWSKLGVALGDAKLWPLALAALLNFVCLWGKAACWKLMLAPRYQVKTLRLFRYTIAAFAASVIAPARAGEVLRLWVLRRREGVPIADSAAVALAEKLLDGATMLLLVAPVPLLLPGLPAWVGNSILLCAGIAVGVFIGLYIAVGRVGRVDSAGASSWFARFIAGMHVLRSPRRLLLSIVTLVLVWLADLAMVMLVLYAVDIDLPIAGGLLILFTVNLTIMVPSTPASVGALEVGALAATNLMGVPYEPAFAFALLYHALQVLPLIIVGLVIEFPLVIGRERASETEPDAAPFVPLAKVVER